MKCRATGLDASLLFLSTSRRCSRKRSPSLLPVSPMCIGKEGGREGREGERERRREGEREVRRGGSEGERKEGGK